MNIRNQKGMTLLELVVVIGLVVSVLFSIVSLTIMSIQVQRVTEGSFQAGQVAREGIEIVRNIRDSNWLKSGQQAWAWDAGLVGSAGDNDGVVNFNPAATSEEETASLDFSVNDISQAGLYSHDDGNGGFYLNHEVSSSPTGYYRLVTVEPFCSSVCYSEVPASCNSNIEPIGLKITSKVQWPTSQGLKNLQLVDYLYNWR